MGGPGSGHHGHKGRKGKRGGSIPSKGTGILSPTDTNLITAEETFNTIRTRQSIGETPVSITGSVFRGTADINQPTRAILERSEFLTGVEGRTGIFATNNEDEAAFFAVVSAVTRGAGPKDIWDGSSKWDMNNQTPAIFKLVNSEEVKHWEEWKPSEGAIVDVPFVGMYNEIILKDINTPSFTKVRDVTQSELADGWDYMVANGWGLTLQDIIEEARGV